MINEWDKKIKKSVLGLALKIFDYTFKYMIAPIIRFLWIEEVEGEEYIDIEKGMIFAANHQSYFDFICLTAIIHKKRTIHYLAAEKFYESLFWKPIMIATQQIKVERESHDKKNVHEKVLTLLSENKAIGIFPEGTRSRNNKMLKAFDGISKFSLLSEKPIVPVGIKGTYEILPPHKKIPRLKKCKIKIGRPLYFNEHYSNKHNKATHSLITQQVMIKISELAEKEYPHKHI